MNDDSIDTIAQVRDFLTGTGKISFSLEDKEQRYARLTLGFGTRAANRAMKSTDGWPPRSKATWVVPSR